MGSNYRVRAAIEEGRRKQREKRQRELEADEERQRKKKEALESTNSIKNFREKTEEMHDKILKPKDQPWLNQ